MLGYLIFQVFQLRANSHNVVGHAKLRHWRGGVRNSDEHIVITQVDRIFGGVFSFFAMQDVVFRFARKGIFLFGEFQDFERGNFLALHRDIDSVYFDAVDALFNSPIDFDPIGRFFVACLGLHFVGFGFVIHHSYLACLRTPHIGLTALSAHGKPTMTINYNPVRRIKSNLCISGESGKFRKHTETKANGKSAGAKPLYAAFFISTPKALATPAA